MLKTIINIFLICIGLFVATSMEKVVGAPVLTITAYVLLLSKLRFSQQLALTLYLSLVFASLYQTQYVALVVLFGVFVLLHTQIAFLKQHFFVWVSICCLAMCMSILSEISVITLTIIYSIVGISLSAVLIKYCYTYSTKFTV